MFLRSLLDRSGALRLSYAWGPVGYGVLTQAEKEFQWYAAHMVFGYYIAGEAEPTFMYENIVLFGGFTSEEAFEKAEEFGRESSLETTLTIGGKPGEERYLGIKRLITCLDAPGEGVEVTYLHLRLQKGTSAKDYLENDEASVLYEGD
jgi:hypothetical protein